MPTLLLIGGVLVLFMMGRTRVGTDPNEPKPVFFRPKRGELVGQPVKGPGGFTPDRVGRDRFLGQPAVLLGQGRSFSGKIIGPTVFRMN